MHRLHFAAGRFAILVLCGVVMAGGVVGCGGPQNAATTPAANAPAPSAMAVGIPEDIPVYDGLVQDFVDSGSMIVVNGTTDDDIPQVLSFYRERFPAKGWVEGSDPTAVGGGAEGLVYTKGSAKAVVLVSNDEGKTRVSLQVEGYVAGQ